MSPPPEQAPKPGDNASPAPGKSAKSRTLKVVRLGLGLVCAGIAVAAIWSMLGSRVWEEYQAYREVMRASEDSAPVGYIGLNYRRTYNNRAPRFLFAEEDGRTRLWASIGDGETPEFYDVTDATFDPNTLEGGFGRDSIPGVDVPILQAPDGEVARNLPDGREVVGLTLEDGPRAYPVELLQKVEVVNDTDSATPFALVYCRGPDEVGVYRRDPGGRPVTLGTTGYAVGGKVPLLYDRATRSLWLPSEDHKRLVCVSGELAGEELPTYKPATRLPWGDWLGRHRRSTVLVGNDREPPIPEE